MINLSITVSGDQVGSALCDDTEELARCLIILGQHFKRNTDAVAEDISNLHNELCNLQGCTDVRALGTILCNMQGD